VNAPLAWRKEFGAPRLRFSGRRCNRILRLRRSFLDAGWFQERQPARNLFLKGFLKRNAKVGVE